MKEYKKPRLVLGRREGQRIFIGEDIVIDIARIDGEEVKIGVSAPAEVKIVREELVRD